MTIDEPRIGQLREMASAAIEELDRHYNASNYRALYDTAIEALASLEDRLRALQSEMQRSIFEMEGALRAIMGEGTDAH